MKKILAFVCACILAVCSVAYSADVEINWEQVPNADGYKLETSEDLGATWNEVPNLVWTPYTEGGIARGKSTITIPDNILILIRAGSYDSRMTAWRYEFGVFYNSAWKPLLAPTGIGAK